MSNDQVVIEPDAVNNHVYIDNLFNDAASELVLSDTIITDTAKQCDNYQIASNINSNRTTKVELCNNITLFNEKIVISLIEEFHKNDDDITLENLSIHENTLEIIIKNLRSIYPLTNFNNHKIDECFSNVIKSHNLLSVEAVVVKGDGNCFYRSLSLLLFGYEEYYLIIKISIIFIMYKNKAFFEYFHRLDCNHLDRR